MHILQDTSVLYHETSRSTFKKAAIISSIFSNHKVMRLEINYKNKNHRKHKYVWPKQNATKQSMDHCKIKEEFKIYLETNEMKTQCSKIFGMLQSNSKREVYSNTALSGNKKNLKYTT